jgi:hypothetical protein
MRLGADSPGRISWAGDVSGYRRVCESILEMPGIAEERIVYNRISRACTMAPDAVADFSKPLTWWRHADDKQPRVVGTTAGAGELSFMTNSSRSTAEKRQERFTGAAR